MPIESICKGCARKLRVADEFAGRKARCPHCHTVYTVPGTASAPTEQPVQWRVRTEDGKVYGPAAKTEIDAWVAEGRITAASQLQRTDQTEWRPAASLYPTLAETAKIAESKNPFTDRATPAPNPYTSPTSPLGVRRPHRALRPHRGGTVLIFGVLGIACCIIFAPIAWSMGHSDLREIRSGVMDPSGRGLTQAGMVLGIIGTVLFGLQLIIGVFGIAMDM